MSGLLVFGIIWWFSGKLFCYVLWKLAGFRRFGGREKFFQIKTVLSCLIFSSNVQTLALTLMKAILPNDMTSQAASVTLQLVSPTFVTILATLANARDGSGHCQLMAYALWWLDALLELLKDKDCAQKMHSQTEVGLYYTCRAS